MPRINVKEEFVDLCLDCWEEPDLDVIAKLLYATPDEVEKAIELEEDGGYHPSYDKEICACDLCGQPLTVEDNVGKEIEAEEKCPFCGERVSKCDCDPIDLKTRKAW